MGLPRTNPAIYTTHSRSLLQDYREQIQIVLGWRIWGVNRFQIQHPKPLDHVISFFHFCGAFQRIVQFWVHHDCWIKALRTHLYRVSLKWPKKYSQIPVGRCHKFENKTIHRAVNRSSCWNLSRLTLRKCVFSTFNQWSWQTLNWTISNYMFFVCLFCITVLSKVIFPLNLNHCEIFPFTLQALSDL